MIRIFTTLVILVLASVSTSLGALSLHPLFSDHSVLQRNQIIPVWGTAEPGTRVSVTFRDQTVSTTTGSDGHWQVSLKPLKLGEAAVLTAASGEDVVTASDVLVGEVWICSGQSNMEWMVQNSNNAEAEIASANHPKIRLFDVERRFSPTPIRGVDSVWQVCSPESVGSFSAVGYYFGRELHDALNVPVGLISAAWGGTRAEPWTPLATLEVNELYKKLVEETRIKTDQLLNNPEIEFELQAEDEAFRQAINSLAESPPLPEEAWFDPRSTFPGMQAVEPNTNFFGETEGLVHVRSNFLLTKEEAALKNARIRLGQIDNYDITWINGVKVGSTGPASPDARRELRDYPLPDGVLQEGENTVLLQIVDIHRTAKFGAKIEHPEIYWSNGDTYPLVDWNFKVIKDIGLRPETWERRMRQAGGFLYNGMIRSVMPYGIRGVIWYQGESNTGQAEQYYTLFPDMIESWRENWGRGDFPFYYVQLANYQERATEPSDHQWAELRDAQLATLKLPKTGMAVTIDIGDPDDVHPRDKQSVGKRLALWALAKTYGQTEAINGFGNWPLIGQLFQRPIAHSGPLFSKQTRKGDTLILDFEHDYEGLETSDGRDLVGFAIAEEDGEFKWADARIKGRQVILSHPKMEQPTVVRYGWGANPEVNLINSAGLPASPFRTDSRQLITAGQRYTISKNV